MENRDEQDKMAVVDLNEVKTLVTIFDKDPECGWGLRGDAYLWNLLRAQMGGGVPPNTAEEFGRVIEDIYEKITGVSVSESGRLSDDGREEDSVPFFKDVGGESCGCVSRVKWRDEIVPILVKRYKAECESALKDRWMTYQIGPKRRLGANVVAFLRWVNRKGNECIGEDLKPIRLKEITRGKGCFFDGKHNRMKKRVFGDLIEQYVKAKNEVDEEEWAELDFQSYNY